MEDTAVLSGGTRDGESTPVASEVTRVVAPSSAPGLVDVYEATGEDVPLRGGGAGRLFRFVAQEPADAFAPEALHAPSGD